MEIKHIFKDVNRAFNFILNKERLIVENRIMPLVISPHKRFRSNPFQTFFNDADDDKFIMMRLQSGCYSLKPNLRNRAYLFRGQNTFFDPSKPSLFRSGAQRFLLESIASRDVLYDILSSISSIA